MTRSRDLTSNNRAEWRTSDVKQRYTFWPSSRSRVNPLLPPIIFDLHFDVDAMSDTTSAHDHPDLPQSTVPRFGTPGTPDFFASVLRFVRTTAPGVPLDPVIFQSIVLSIMAGNKHVLLRTKEEDIAIVQNLAVLVSNLLQLSSALFING
jgi:hypothetical protein